MSQAATMLRVPAEVEQLAAVRQFVREAAARAGAAQAPIDDLVQAVDESVTNVIVHGYGGAQGFVEIGIEDLDGALIVRLRDEAKPFDPTKLPDPDTTLPLDRRPFHGMGAFLTRQLSDEVTYRQTDNGNELTIVKRYRDNAGGTTC